MGEPNRIQDQGEQLVAATVARLAVGEIGEVAPEDCDCFEIFQDAWAAAADLEAFGLIDLIEVRPARGSLIGPLRFRRMR